MKPICFLFLSVTRINPCLKQQRYQKNCKWLTLLDISVISPTFATLPVAHHSSQYSEKLSICGAGKENPWRLMNPPFSHSLFGKIFWWELQQRFLHNKCQITEPFLHNFVHCGSKALTHISKIGTWKSFICPNNIFFLICGQGLTQSKSSTGPGSRTPSSTVVAWAGSEQSRRLQDKFDFGPKPLFSTLSDRNWDHAPSYFEIAGRLLE